MAEDIKKENTDGLQDVTDAADEADPASAGEAEAEAKEAAGAEAEQEETSAEEEEQDDDEAVDAEFVSLEEGEEQAAEKKSFFKKNKKDKRDAQIEELTDRVRRQMAEFDNFRKRTEKEKSAMFEVGAKSVIEKILPVVDSFERGLATADGDADPFVEGMQKTYKQLMTTLESMDVKPIDAVGQEFNPDLHNAVMHVDDESVGENIVVEELQKGYTYRDSVIRYSMVKVAN